MGKTLKSIASVAIPVIGLASGTGWFTAGFWKGAGMLALGALAQSGQKNEGPRLESLGVQLAQENADLPRGWGVYRQSATLVYCPGLNETKKTRGGKGGPKTTEYKYHADFMLIGGRGPITRLNRIRFGDKVIYDYNNGAERGFKLIQSVAGHWASEKSGNVRVYPGTLNQPVDSLLQSKKGIGNWTSYPTLWGVMFEHQALEKYGNAIPNATFEPFNAVTGLDAVVTEVCGWRGLTPDELFLDELVGISVAPGENEGYVVGSRRSAASVIEELGVLHNFTLRECNGVYEAVRRGRVSVAILRGHDLLQHTDGEATLPLEEKRADETELPVAGEINFSDPGREFNPGLRTARRADAPDDAAPGARGGRRDSISITAAMSGGRALRAARIALHEKWARADAYPLSLSPSWLRLAAGDCVTVETPDGQKEVYLPQITQPFFGAISSLAPGVDRLLYDLPIVADDGGGWDSPAPATAQTPVGMLIDCVALSESSPDMVSKPGVMLVATQAAGGQWSGAQIIVEGQEDDGTWKKIKTESVTYQADSGYLRAPWNVGAPDDGYNGANPLLAQMYEGELNSVTDAQVRAGRNVLLFENGLVISFTSADDAGGGAYTLTGIKSGRWGSDYSATGIGGQLPTGARFVIVSDDEGEKNEDAKWITLDPKWIGRQVRARFQPRGEDDAYLYESVRALDYHARNTEPLSPSGVRATRDEAGTLTLEGRARTRYANDGSWRGATLGRLSEKPTSQGYAFEVVLTSGAFSRAVTLYTSDPQASFVWNWTKAQLAALLGRTEAEITASEVRGTVAMRGEFGFGRTASWSAI